MASIEKQLNSANGSSGIKPWSLSNMNDSTHDLNNPSAAAVPSNGQLNAAQSPTTTRPGTTAVALTDATQQSATTSAHPNNSHANAGVDNALGGPVNTDFSTLAQQNGPANAQPADVATYGAADPLSKQGYSIMGE